MNISASGLTMQRLRMDIISSNIANAETTRATMVDGQWQPYRRKMIAAQPYDTKFGSLLQQAMNKSASTGQGVKVTGIREDQTDFKLVYDPEHPDAQEDGYVRMPNVDVLKEMVDLMSSTRSYEANVTALNATKGMLLKALEIGK